MESVAGTNQNAVGEDEKNESGGQHFVLHDFSNPAPTIGVLRNPTRPQPHLKRKRGVKNGEVKNEVSEVSDVLC